MADCSQVMVRASARAASSASLRNRSAGLRGSIGGASGAVGVSSSVTSRLSATAARWAQPGDSRQSQVMCSCEVATATSAKRTVAFPKPISGPIGTGSASRASTRLRTRGASESVMEAISAGEIFIVIPP